MPSYTADSAIGFFDSGVGGLTVFQAVASILPHENLIYLGDMLRLPYGNKLPETILRYSLECSLFLIEKKIKLLIIACHTASAYAFEELEQQLSIPVVSVVQTCSGIFREKWKNSRIAILGTASAIASNVHQKLIQSHCPSSKIFSFACPLFVPLAEENFRDHEASRLIALHYLSPLKELGIEAVLLACTHYPLLKEVIQAVLEPKVVLLDPAMNCAEQAKFVLNQGSLLNKQLTRPIYEFYTTEKDLERFARVAKNFLGPLFHLGTLQFIILGENNKLTLRKKAISCDRRSK